MTPTPRSGELRSIAQDVADALPSTIEEVVLTGSVSRGVADHVSDIEMLVVTPDQLELEDCYTLAAACGLSSLGSWGQQGVPAKRVSGYRDGVPVELIWWSRAHAESSIDAIFAGDLSSTADALANGVSLRTSGLLASWQERLRTYPDELAASRIEEAALKWGGFAPEGFLTILRPGERVAVVEWLADDAARVLRILFALNRVWQPTAKRLADRVETLPRKPDRFAGRMQEALTEPDARRALRAMTDLQLDTLALAPGGPNVDRARAWLQEVRAVLTAPV
jgi:hypothetical protein